MWGAGRGRNAVMRILFGQMLRAIIMHASIWDTPSPPAARLTMRIRWESPLSVMSELPSMTFSKIHDTALKNFSGLYWMGLFPTTWSWARNYALQSCHRHACWQCRLHPDDARHFTLYTASLESDCINTQQFIIYGLQLQTVSHNWYSLNCYPRQRLFYSVLCSSRKSSHPIYGSSLSLSCMLIEQNASRYSGLCSHTVTVNSLMQLTHVDSYLGDTCPALLFIWFNPVNAIAVLNVLPHLGGAAGQSCSFS